MTAQDRCPVCGGPTDQFWPGSGNPDACSPACEIAELGIVAPLYASPEGVVIVRPGLN